MSRDHYNGFAPCPHCFESSGYAARVYPATWDEPAWADVDYSEPCPYCDHTGYVECEPIDLDDIEDMAAEEDECAVLMKPTCGPDDGSDEGPWIEVPAHLIDGPRVLKVSPDTARADVEGEEEAA